MKVRRNTTLAGRFAALLLSLFVLCGMLPIGALAEDAELVYQVSYRWDDDSIAPFAVAEATADAPKTTGTNFVLPDLTTAWGETWGDVLSGGQYGWMGWKVTDAEGEELSPNADGSYTAASDLTVIGIWNYRDENGDVEGPDTMEPLADKYSINFAFDWEGGKPTGSGLPTEPRVSEKEENKDTGTLTIQKEFDPGGGVLLPN